MTGSLESIRNDPRKKIAIVGKAPSSFALAPYADDSWQIWTLSDLVLCKQAPRFDVHTELHDTELLRSRQPYFDWLASITDQAVLLRAASPEIPHGEPFPKDEIIEYFGRYFTNTVSWLIALAITMKPEKIGVWGVDMACTEEYTKQRPSCEYFLGWAKGAGIDVYLPPQADMLKAAGLYGFDTGLTDMHAKWKTRCAELTGRVEAAEKARDQHEQEVAYLRGGIEYCVDEANKAALQKDLPTKEAARDHQASLALYLRGALEDCRDYWGQWATNV